MQTYFIRDSYCSQIEAYAVVGLRFGFTAFGIALGKAKTFPRWLPLFRADFWAHTGQCDQRWLFRVRVGRFTFGYRMRGEATPGFLTYGDAGLRFSQG